MTLCAPDAWANLLWKYFGPQIQSGSPFYLAIDSTLIHSLSYKDDTILTTADSLLYFNQACQQLFYRRQNRICLDDKALRPLPAKFYSTAICLAAQQVLIVEQMLDSDEYSSRAYFPWYRKTLGIQSGYKHENPLVGSDFQRIWSTLRNEIQMIPGSSSVSVTFEAGKGVDLNRNLPFSQALLTHRDLFFLHNNAQFSLKESSDTSILELLLKLRSNFNRRAKELISNASTDERLQERLCEQIRSFEIDMQQRTDISSRKKEAAAQEYLVAYRDLDNWIDQIYCIFSRAEERQFDEIPSSESISKQLAETGMTVLIRRDDHYKQISESNPFIPFDAVMLIIRKNQLDKINGNFTQHYPNLTISSIATNLSDEFLLLDCGSLPHSHLFDPLGKATATMNEPPPITFLGGLTVDARSNTFLTSYPPTVIVHRGKKLAQHLKLTVNGVEVTVDAILRKLLKTRTLSSYVIEFSGDRVELTLSPASFKSKGQVLLGFALDGGSLDPVATTLNESQPSLKGTLLIDEPMVSENTLISLSVADLLVFTRRGQRIKLSAQSLDILGDAIRQSHLSHRLVELILRDIYRTKSVPIEALQVPTIRAVLRETFKVDNNDPIPKS